MEVLVIDVGGSHVKLRITASLEVRSFPSDSVMTPELLVSRVRATTNDWKYDVISLGLPAVVGGLTPTHEPGNLGDGWIGFDFVAAFSRPVRIVNDAVMQALGSYDDGRMLFLGLGTGLGSALVAEHVVVPLELGNLRWQERETLSDRVGREGLQAHGHERWSQDVLTIAHMLQTAFVADYVVLGGGNAERLGPLPAHVRRGGNKDAFEGGFRLWAEMVEPHDREPHRVWRVLR